MTKDEFIFSCILSDYDEDYADLPCEEKYDNNHKLFKDFEKSPYNEKHLPIADCIERYLLDKQANQNNDPESDDDYIL